MQATDPRTASRTRLALSVAVLILLGAIAVVLAQSASRRSGTNGIPSETFAVVLAPGDAVCQPGELIPGDTTALQATIGTYGLPGPRVQVTATASSGESVTQGGLAPGWRQGVVSLPVALVRQTTPGVRVCLRDQGPSRIAIGGSAPFTASVEILGAQRSRSASAGLRFDYMRPGHESWFSLLPTLWHRMTLAKGDLVRHWAPWGALVLMVVAGALSVAALGRRGARAQRSPQTTGQRQRLRRLPWAARACFVVALANGLAWSLITPPFEVPDENAHYAYVAQLAERGRLPHLAGGDTTLSPAEDAITSATGFSRAVGIRQDPVILTEAQQRVIDALTREKLSARGSGYAGGATSAPPLYYLTQVLPFWLAPQGSVLNRLSLMRAVSAVMGAITVLLIFLFLAEVLPGTPWVWTAGALAAALQPLFGFMSGGVNYDDLQYLFAAALLLAMARMLRRGLTGRGAVEVGLALGLGLVTKVAMAGLAPAAALTLLLVLSRARARPRQENLPPQSTGAEPHGWGTRQLALRASRGEALAAVALTVLLALVPLLAYVAWGRVSPNAQGLVPGGLSAAPAGASRLFHFRQELTHIWQLFLPHLWQRPQFSYFPLWQTWFEGFFGRFGWLDYAFSGSVFVLMLVVALGTCALALIVLVRGGCALRRRLSELAVYALAVAGVCVVIGAVSYRILIETGAQFEQARYLLPLLGLYALIVALASRVGGRSWGPVVGVLLVVLALGHDVFSQLLTIQRYYS